MSGNDQWNNHMEHDAVDGTAGGLHNGEIDRHRSSDPAPAGFHPACGWRSSNCFSVNPPTGSHPGPNSHTILSAPSPLLVFLRWEAGVSQYFFCHVYWIGKRPKNPSNSANFL